ncbi:MAG TPA: molybdopterin cofactor-binding domain-containing protein [Xanthobacteraceae bacterium]|jgi:CO/xanthine dehydrogenase Mo-binding subunit
MTALDELPISRRAALRGGGALIVSFAITPLAIAQQPGASGGPPRLPGSLRTAPMLDSWIRIDSDNRITLFTGKSELGQGIKTALLQLAAEQLGVAPGAITLVTSDTARTPNEGYTSGSQSMPNSGTAIWNAAAQVREILISLAAARLSLSATELKAEGGAIVASDGRRLSFGELVAGDVLHVRAQPVSNLKDPRSHTIVGRSLPRIDIPAKVTGGVAYVHDLRLDGMVHARVVRPPSYGARLAGIDVAAVETMPGVQKVVRDGNFLAVIADREFSAVKAMEALAAAARWEEQGNLPDQAEFYSWLKQQPKRTITIKDEHADAAPAAKTLQAEYLRPYMMHGSIGPSCAVAQYVDENLTVWSHAQGMFPLRHAVAELTKLPEERVRCIHMEGAGCYGHNGADDAAADAAYLAVAYPGVPVRVQWTRDQEHQWEPYGSAMAMDAKASLDGAGRIVDWDYTIWSDTHSMRPGGAGATLVGQSIATPFPIPPPQPGTQPAGFADRNIVPLYKIPNLRLIYNFVPHQRIRVSALRSLGAYANVFAIESFMDELAAAADIDPIEFRLKHLDDQRAIDVIKLAAEKFGWRVDAKLPAGRAYGFAFARYKNNLETYCAVAVELDVEHETGRVRLIRAVAAADSGEAVNPDGIKLQIAGGIIQSASWTLNEAVAFDHTRILSRDWSSYPILRFPDVFNDIEVHVIDRPGQPFLGTGEASQGPSAAAIANALANATGHRLRELPFTRGRIKAAIGV